MLASVMKLHVAPLHKRGTPLTTPTTALPRSSEPTLMFDLEIVLAKRRFSEIVSGKSPFIYRLNLTDI
ncbi:hypothetical protein RTCIAT899_PB00055 (plasmid) [Rhizobium tropici CIAT 899]|nr:hypothetical protein RTCIAT899_PB00055 [Rhizobium tropici CIAT 899]